MPFEQRLRGQKEAVGGDFDRSLQIFIADRKRAGCTERTIEWYEEVLGCYFRKFLEERRLDLNPNKWISTDIEDYMDYLLNERGCKPVTCKNRFSAIRAWCNFLYKKNYIESNPIASLAPMKVKKEVTKTLPDEVLDKILKKPDMAKCTFADFRDWAIMWTLFDTGIRVNELVHIRIQDVHLDEAYILITHGKGQKERPVGISKTLFRVLQKYLTIREPQTEYDFLFCNSFGEQLSKDTVRKRLHEYGDKVGIKGMTLSPHKFRYTFAKHYIKNGGDPFRLQKALGHSSIEIVRNYVEMFGSDVIEAHEQII
ncbi:tyrosine-type recombinase/integrase [Aneurinibacillus terranovensis]|uniref:tyrosine-type recombinase/integrase n=1 Tax=Aneurinibacillus terranovensis TaxID=278991 RepID=UPI001B7F8F91